LQPVAPPLETVPTPIGDVPAPDSSAFDWLPAELSRTFQSTRNFRWPTVISSVVLAAAVVFGVWWSTGQPERAAAERLDAYNLVVAELSSARTDFDEAVVLITTQQDLNAAGPSILSFSTASEQAASVASDPIPRSVPLADAAPLVELEQKRQLLAVASGRASGLAVEATRFHAYIAGVSQIFRIPELPKSATAAAANELSIDLAAVLSDSLGQLTDLPDIPAFANHRAELELLIGRFGDWQIDYLEGLRIGDLDRVEALLTELEAELLAVSATLDEPLREVATDLLDRSHRLSVELSELQ
ncbi:MAG: hypothetical protein KJO18_03550, partial [Acidimicrobiia bacterium]|nr:hypothetical protein [Acidimicrobiia bacterium]